MDTYEARPHQSQLSIFSLRFQKNICRNSINNCPQIQAPDVGKYRHSADQAVRGLLTPRTVSRLACPFHFAKKKRVKFVITKASTVSQLPPYVEAQAAALLDRRRRPAAPSHWLARPASQLPPYARRFHPWMGRREGRKRAAGRAMHAAAAGLVSSGGHGHGQGTFALA